MMNATKERSEATQANSDATSAIVTCSESANAKANKETTVAVGGKTKNKMDHRNKVE